MDYYDKCFKAPSSGIEWVIYSLDTDLSRMAIWKEKHPSSALEWFASVSFVLYVKPKKGTRTDDELASACVLRENKHFINYVKNTLMGYILYKLKGYEPRIQKIYFPQRDSFRMGPITIPTGEKLSSGLYTQVGEAKGIVIVKATD
ncbi:hypothetical protein GYA37_02870 [candidate division WWE3 bacterium]|uniref:Uncharacterized protein n=1 Tax=candidate division WWE3 bacterium TaxID=2053526 RepID=A0A7X9E763_UNCKA|nr:hypothetical protein [candidate division WWE3 bacterium]